MTISIIFIIAFAIILASAVALIIEPRPKKEPAKEMDGSSHRYRYQYQQFPFGDWIIFTVEAEDKKAANQRAIEIFTEMFGKQETIMTVFYPA